MGDLSTSLEGAEGRGREPGVVPDTENFWSQQHEFTAPQGRWENY